MKTLKYLQHVKLVFTACMLLVLGFSTLGIILLDENIYLTKRYALLTKDYLKYAFEYNRDSGVAQAAAPSSGYYATNPMSDSYISESATSVPVLLYHRILDESDGFNVSRDTFKEQLFALKRNGYNTVGLEDMLQYMRGEKELPAKSILITFDDGAKDSFYNADPILKVTGFKAVNFIITEHSLGNENDSYYLNEKEVKVMVASGRWEIGSHTDSGHGQVNIGPSEETGNFLSNRRWLADEGRLETVEEYKERIRFDLENSKQKIETAIGTRVLGFAFPYGDYGHESRNVIDGNNIVKSIATNIFPMSFFQPFSKESSLNTPSQEEKVFYIRRISVRPEWSADDMLRALSQ